LFVYGSHYGHDFEDAAAYGWDLKKGDRGLDWGRLIKNKNAEIERLNGIYKRLLDNSGVELKVGSAVMKDPHSVEVGGEIISAEKVLVAVGGKPYVPDFEGREHVITSNEAFFLKDLPKRVIIVGGGYIGVEFACIFDGYGSEVTLTYRRDLFLNGFDLEVRQHLAEQMRAQGLNLKFNCDITKVVKNDDGTFTATTNTGESLAADVIMYATGRVPDTAALGLGAVGVKTGRKGKIEVDDWGCTNVENVFAIGDVTDRVNLTPVAIAEGHAFADTHYGGNKRNIGYDNIPTAVFSNPNIGTCGLTEEEARKKYGDNEIAVFKTSFRPMKHTLTKRDGEKVFMKLLVVRSTDVVVGCHILDGAAGDVIQLVGVAMKAGATKKHFDTTMPVHPVSAEELVTMRTESK
jgi:glutathione reductase (NADPH)